MIIIQNENTPVVSPQFADMEAALETYKTFTGNNSASMADFILFLTTPSVERTDFLSLFTFVSELKNDIYYTLTYSDGIE